MSNTSKIILRIVAFFILLYLVAVALLATFLKPDHYKGYIDHFVYEKTGRHLIINGDISLSFFPWMGLKVSNLTLGNPENFPTSDKPYFIHLNEANIKIAFWPLFVGKISPKLITFKGADINLITTPSGRINWNLRGPTTQTSVVVAPAKTKTAPSQAPSNEEIPHTANNFTIVSIPQIAIVDSQISWNNQQNNHLLQVKNFNLRTSSIGRRNASYVHTSFDVIRNNPDFDIIVDANSNVLFDINNKQFNLLDIDINGKAQKFLGRRSPNPIPFSLKGNLHLDLAKQTLALEKITATVANIKAQINANAQDILSIGKIEGNLNILSFNPSQTLQQFQIPLHTQNNSSLQNLAFQTQFQASPKYIKLTNIKGILDKSKLEGNIDFSVLPNKNIDFDFNLNQFNVSNYMLTAKKGSAKPKFDPNQVANKSAHDNINSATLIPVQALRDVNWDGKLHIGKLLYQNVTFTNVNLLTKEANNTINIAPLNATLDKGQIESKIQININSNTPVIKSTLSINNAPVAPLLSLMTPEKALDGNINLQSQFNTQGNTQAELIKTLNGQGKFELHNGTIYGFNITNAVQQALMAIHKQTATQNNDGNDMEVADLSLQFSITNGVLNSYNLQLLSNNIKANGTGQLNLADQSVIYHIQTHIAGVDFPVPILISGTLTKPKIQPDIKAIGQQVLQHAVKQKVGKLFNSIFGH